MRTKRAGWSVLTTVVLVALAAAPAAAQTSIAGGGSKRTDCLLETTAPGATFPAGRKVRGLACRDGDICDADGVANGRCRFATSVCINVTDPALPRCRPAGVRSIKVSKVGDATPGLQAAVAGFALPSSTPACSAEVPIEVAVGGADRFGEPQPGRLNVRLRARGRKGQADRDKVALVCLPDRGTNPPTTGPGAGTPGAGLQATITAATVAADGALTVTFMLTDAAGAPVAPVLAATRGPDEARVRFTIARLDVDTQAIEGTNTVTFTRYRNYVLNSGGQPAYDAGGTLGVVDSATGTYTYTFATALPAGFDATRTHSIGAQVERTFEGAALVGNPVFDFVPAGGAVSTIRQEVTTQECNACHGALAVHGGGRRETRLCQLCHTDQGGDPDTGNSIDFQVLIHKIHRGKDLPSLQGAVGDTYSIVGFQGSEAVYGRRVRLCSGGERDHAACTSDADCQVGANTGGTCVDEIGSTIKVAGVGFPQDLRACEVCHTQGATAAHYKEKPSTAACQSCHDDANPGQVALDGLAPGTNHIPGPQPDGRCLLCHPPGGDEFSLGVAGAHTVPERSAQLAGLVATILDASGAPGGPVTVHFAVTDGAGAPVDVSGFNRVGFAYSGPTTADSQTKPINPTAVGGGASGTLTPQGGGVYQYVSSGANGLPANATGTWRIGLEARRNVTVGNYCVGGTRNALPCDPDGCPSGTCGYAISEAAQNPVLDFSVDGSAVAPRPAVVDTANCQSCHGVFSQGFSVHGNLRNRTDYCLVCHNPTLTDFGRRVSSFCAVTCGGNGTADTSAGGDDVQVVPQGNACSSTACVVSVGDDGVSETTAAAGDAQRVASGAGAGDDDTQTVNLKPLIHRIHSGEELSRQPYLIYGFGGAPLNFTPVDLGEVLYPNDRRRCEACHLEGTQLLPVGAVMRATDVTRVNATTLAETLAGSVPPVQDACLSCHDGDAALAHAATNTAGTLEACDVCHGEGRVAPVSASHATP
jgi:OmcA/MtrC family decaheme c-type cytochrome